MLLDSSADVSQELNRDQISNKKNQIAENLISVHYGQ
jgi:hypothetical protein